MNILIVDCLGYSLKVITKPIRIMKLLGVEAMFATNAAGSLNPKFQIGDIMVMRDHLNFLSFGGTVFVNIALIQFLYNSDNI